MLAQLLLCTVLLGDHDHPLPQSTLPPQANAALALAAAARERQPQSTLPADEPLDPKYVAAYQKFVTTKVGDRPYYSALVVFVGTPLQDREGYWSPILVEVPKLRGFTGPCIVVGVWQNGELVVGRVHQGSAFGFDIYEAWLAVAFPSPLPRRPPTAAPPIVQPPFMVPAGRMSFGGFAGNCFGTS